MPSNTLITESGIIGLSDRAWAEARRRAEVISQLTLQQAIPNNLIFEAAQKLNVTERTVYNFIRRWRQSDGSVVSLAPKGSNGGKGKNRLPQEVNSIISMSIEDTYLSRQKLSIAALMRKIRGRCRQKKFQPPSVNTVKLRLDRLNQKEVLHQREGAEAVRHLQPIEGEFPLTETPLDVVQIDHTPVDLIVVDPFTRQSIGRPWITVAIDVYSRCIIGFCLTLEPPSAVSVGLCLVHSVTDKRPWLERMGVEAEWPMSGKPRCIHVDNGIEFHSEALRRGCEVHGIRIIYRPIGSPHYGGIIERVIGTLMTMVHELPGTTFSNIAERGAYSSIKTAVLSLEDLEKWFALAITTYHLSLHSGVGEPPIVRWKRALEKKEEIFRVQNPKAFLVDFLPITHRQIQRQGFIVDHITYMCPALKPWIGDRGSKHVFTIRRDPRDLSRIYALHPKESSYVEVPYRTLSNPAVTLWEHRLAIKRLREENKKLVDEETIFKMIEQMRFITEKSTSTSLSARRSVARREHLKSPKPEDAVSIPPSSEDTAVPPSERAKLFDEIEEW